MVRSFPTRAGSVWGPFRPHVAQGRAASPFYPLRIRTYIVTAHSKITREHLGRDAIAYIRQSGAHQVRHNQESRRRQYALVERAKSLGWPARSIKTVDDDQGRTATCATHRHGFKKLMAEVGAGQVGIILALEASRLARSNADWHRLVEICVVTNTLLADETAIYDPRDPNDRLLLGVKGTISEAELFTLRQRLHEGRWNKARRGELTRPLPVGYVRREDGQVIKAPDRQVQARLEYVFELFGRLRVARQVLVRLAEEKLKMPTKVWGGARHGEVIWKAPDHNALIRILHNPTYAGAYVFGQWESDPFDRSPTNGRASVHLRPVEQWPVCIQDAYPAYISWEQFLANQQQLHDNWYRGDRQGAPRKGLALLQGIVFCGRCGARMSVRHYSTKEKRAPAYGCFHAYQQYGGKGCQYFSARGVDEAITELFLDAVSPAKAPIALQALEELETDHREAAAQWEVDLRQAEYEVALARRRYEAADPENRLVAGQLEATWEQAMREMNKRQREYQAFLRRQDTPLSARDRRLVQELSADLAKVWHAQTTSMEERKTLLRFLVKRVHLDGVTETGKIRIEVEWHTGAHSSLLIDRPEMGGWAPRTPKAVEGRIRELLGDHDYEAIAEILNQEGFRNTKGLPFNRYSVGYVVRTRGWGRKGSNGSAAEATR
ncbi:MAG: recombinase family protein [Phycisphaerae bacterium]|nr:recombinase family protein [Phycisphaerae bacterium]